MKGDTSLCMFTVVILIKRHWSAQKQIQFELLLLVYSVGVLYELYLQHFNKNDKNEFVWEKKNHIWAGD